MERHRNRHKWVVALDAEELSERYGLGKARQAERHYRDLLRGIKDTTAQSTVEYALLMGAGLVLVMTLGMLSTAIRSNLFVEHAVFSASHNVSAAIGAIVDVFMY